MKRTERLHALSEMLSRSGSRGCTAEYLAAEFEVSVRTIKRDINALEISGAPIWARPGPGGGYGLASGATLRPVNLSPAQAVSLLAAVTAAPEAPYSDLAAAAVQKILDVLDLRTRERTEQLANRIWVDIPRSPSRAVRSAIEQGMTDQKVLRIHYISSEQTTIREVEPVLFGSTNGHWYLIGWCRLRNAIRWFRMDRIKKATFTSAPCDGHTIDEVGVPPATARPLPWVNRG